MDVELFDFISITLFVAFMVLILFIRFKQASNSTTVDPAARTLLTDELGFRGQRPPGSTADPMRFLRQMGEHPLEVTLKKGPNPNEEYPAGLYSTSFRINSRESGTDIAIQIRQNGFSRLFNPPLEVFSMKKLIGDPEPPVADEDFRSQFEVVGTATESFLKLSQQDQFQEIVTRILHPRDVLEFGEEFILYEVRGGVTDKARAQEIIKGVQALQQLIDGPDSTEVSENKTSAVQHTAEAW